MKKVSKLFCICAFVFFISIITNWRWFCRRARRREPFQSRVSLNVSLSAFQAGCAPQAYFSLAGKVGKRALGRPQTPSFCPIGRSKVLLPSCH